MHSFHDRFDAARDMFCLRIGDCFPATAAPSRRMTGMKTRCIDRRGGLSMSGMSHSSALIRAWCPHGRCRRLRLPNCLSGLMRSMWHCSSLLRMSDRDRSCLPQDPTRSSKRKRFGMDTESFPISEWSWNRDQSWFRSVFLQYRLRWWVLDSSM